MLLDILRKLNYYKKIRRVKKLAIISLLYKVLSNIKFFKKLINIKMQYCFSNEIFSNNTISLLNFLLIYSN